MKILSRLFSKAYETSRINSLKSFRYQPSSPTHSISQFTQLYRQTPTAVILEQSVTLAGRVSRIRDQGKKLVFMDIVSGGSKVQLILNQQLAVEQARTFKRGDILQVSGKPGRTKTGELSLYCTAQRILAPCLKMLPQPNTLLCQQTKQRQRYLDLIVNQEAMADFTRRSQITGELRRLLVESGFLEVETPLLERAAGGATAKPFATRLDQMGLDMFLRISPQLYLKTLIVGGYQKVFQLGKCFRNEGIDLTHNPQFTMVQVYAAYWDYQRMMGFTQDLVRTLAGRFGVAVPVNFQRVEYIGAIQERIGRKIDFLGSERAQEYMLSIFQQQGLKVPQIRTLPRLLDKLCGYLVQPHLKHPTFLIHQPRVLSPLAKPLDSHLSQRFELFIEGREIANGYSQLNDPVQQQSNFNAQQQLRSLDGEAMAKDAQFVLALEHGMPPTAGLGVGVDRLAMWLMGKSSIQRVLLFPTTKPLEK